MADKLTYDTAIVQACIMSGLDEQKGGTPMISRFNGMVRVETGPQGAVTLLTNESDIKSSWDPLSADMQLRARDKLTDSIRTLNRRFFLTAQIVPPMWRVDG
jgi:hypothetical protein